MFSDSRYWTSGDKRLTYMNEVDPFKKFREACLREIERCKQDIAYAKKRIEQGFGFVLYHAC